MEYSPSRMLPDDVLRRLKPVALALALSGATACTVFNGLRPPEALGEDPNGSDDGGETPTLSTEAGADASDPADGAAPPPPPSARAYCDGHKDLAFCADFDTGDLLAAFDGDEQRGGTLRRHDATAVSAPSSLRATLEASALPGAARVYRAAPVGAGAVRVGFDVFFEPCAAAETTVVSLVSFAVGVGYVVELARSGDDLIVRERSLVAGSSLSTSSKLGVSPPQGKWSHVELVLVVAKLGAAGKLTTLLEALSASATLEPRAVGSNVTFYVGAATETGSAGCSLLYDNVTFTPVTGP